MEEANCNVASCKEPGRIKRIFVASDGNKNAIVIEATIKRCRASIHNRFFVRRNCSIAAAATA